MEIRITDPDQPKAEDVKKRIQKLDRYIKKAAHRLVLRQKEFQNEIAQMTPEEQKKFKLGLALFDLGNKGKEV
jgi:hypothetical protein